VFAALGDVDELNCMARSRRAAASLAIQASKAALTCAALAVPRRRAARPQVGLAREFCHELDGAAAIADTARRAPPAARAAAAARRLRAPPAGSRARAAAARRAQLAEVQSRLLDAGSAVATPPSSASDAKLQRTRFGGAPVERLEAAVDALDAALPPLRAFILPSGGRAAAALHAARAVCRRAERAVVPLVRCGDVEPDVAAFLNRLSDYLFAAARTAVRAAAAPQLGSSSACRGP
jgi:ATP:cob(I)alamin adenosyltransferase